MADEPDSLILRLLREMREDMGTMRADMADMREVMATKEDLHSLRADVASDLAGMQAEIGRTRKELGDQIVGLRRAVVEYHTSVIGHGVIISELESRLRRVEMHLNLSDAS